MIKNYFLLLFCYVLITEGQNLEYVKNNGQWNSKIAYECKIQGGVIYVENNKLTFNFMRL